MSELASRCSTRRAEPYAAVPTIVLRLRITEPTGTPVHAVALRCQIRIEPQRRRYDHDEEDAPRRAVRRTAAVGPDSLRPFLWTHVATTVTGFNGATEIDLPVTCTYDFEVAAHEVLPRARRRRDPAGPAVLGHGVRAAAPADSRWRRSRGTRRRRTACRCASGAR